MYAVIESGGKQHRVVVGEVVHVESLPAQEGESVLFDRVLAVGEGDALRVGTPMVDGARVRGTVLRQGRGKKILVYTYKRRQNSNRKRRGHRQAYTAVKIDTIEA